MQFTLAETREAAAAIAAANHTNIRLFNVSRQVAFKHRPPPLAVWRATTPESVKAFSAAGYYFAVEIQKELGVPVGIINSSYGGSQAEAWTPVEYLNANPELKATVERTKVWDERFSVRVTRGLGAGAQPDVGRVGGLLEARAVCGMAAERGLKVVPHCWKTGISISATAHLAFIHPHCAFIEYLPPELCIETLRKELAAEDLRLVDGEIPLPEKPGLGFELNRDALSRYAVA